LNNVAGVKYIDGRQGIRPDGHQIRLLCSGSRRSALLEIGERQIG
jgi:hypothetical protein